MHHRQNIIKCCLYGLILWFFCILQVSLPLRWSTVHALPLVPLTVVVSVFEGSFGGGAFGLAAGLLCDAFTPGSGSFFTLFLMPAGILIGHLVKNYFKVSFVAAMLWAVAAHAAADLLYFLFFMVIPGRAGLSALMQVALPELLLTLPYIPPAYLISRGIHNRFAVRY